MLCSTVLMFKFGISIEVAMLSQIAIGALSILGTAIIRTGNADLNLFDNDSNKDNV